jgi:tRNA A-37 threonylcarbamoyl transferase component Bud32
VPADPRIDTEFAGYHIEALIGRGGMGAVYRARHLRLGRHVALKVLIPDLAEDATFRERFIRESQMAAGFEHPNVIPIYDADEEDGVLYIAMRYVEGSDLKSVLERKGALSPERTLSIIEQTASALDAAHSRGLVHRDVKPANILIADPGDRVYLTDFGVAKQTTSSGLTKTGWFLGTVNYAAPEQIEGKPVSPATDVYALGCVVYECLAGSAPFVKESDVAVIHAHLLEPPPALSGNRPDLPAALDTVVSTALAKAPQLRYATCAALVGALRGALVEAVPARTEAAGAVPETRAAAPAETAPTLPPTVEAAPPATEPLAAGAPPPPSRRWLVPLLVALGALVVAGAAFGIVLLATGDGEPGAQPTTVQQPTTEPAAATTTEPAAATTTEPAPTTTAQEQVDRARNLAYTEQIDRLLTNSAETRMDLGALVRAASNRSIPYDDARGRIAAIINQRQNLQNSVASVETPPAFRQAAELLRKSIRAALDDDFAIQAWINALYRDDPSASRRLSEHLAASKRASAAKQRFVDTYDRLRASLLDLPPLKVGTSY